ncbi:MAG: D,D-heptose 1,7-bisphosphate phosphatase [Nitrospira sp.]|jgi:D,D-heptose 1,7-bisphosphate phosphatase|nr:D,D-heptose 1,7-bisphosphate phosphatase [Nitrospira sp.]
MNCKAVFVDKDGTLIENRPFDWGGEDMRMLPGSVEGLRLLHLAGYALIVVTNQGGIAHGWFTEEAMTNVEITLRIRLAAAGIPLAGFYYCPHHPQGSVPRYTTHCACRKPKPGLLMQAAREVHVDLEQSWMVGDILHDVEAGRWAGCQTVLLTNGNETEWEMSAMRWPDLLADDVLEAARVIVATDQRQASGSRKPFEQEEE